jgi:hypothetical protein
MKFRDASVIVPLLVLEPATRRAQALASRDPDMLVWWGSEVECVSALARLERAAALDGRGMALAINRLKQLADGWHEIEPVRARRGSCAFTRCARPTHCSCPRPSRPRNIVRDRFSSSRSTSVLQTRRGRKALPWSMLPRTDAAIGSETESKLQRRLGLDPSAIDG